MKGIKPIIPPNAGAKPFIKDATIPPKSSAFSAMVFSEDKFSSLDSSGALGSTSMFIISSPFNTVVFSIQKATYHKVANFFQTEIE